jgi:FixJ family two-component response regulator
MREFEMPEEVLISIIDDDALARDSIQELVESLGYKAVSFSSAEHFLASGAIAKTTCVITDLQMPGLSGLEFQEALPLAAVIVAVIGALTPHRPN